jgi:RecA/RadA recombinase
MANRIDCTKYHSDTIEDWYTNQMRAIREGKPFIYITDSFDALDSIDAQKRGEAIIKQSMKKNKASENASDDGDEKEEKEKGSYKTEKAKMLKQIFRSLKGDIAKTESLSLIISQTMADLRPMARGKKTRACGDTLKFYSTHEIWLSRIKKLTDKDLEIGNLIQAKLGKNRLTGKKRQAIFPVYTDYGVDDIVSCLNFLIDSGRITREKNTFTLKELNLSGSKGDIISNIELKNLERELKLVMWDEWKKIEDSVKLDRKPRWN